MVRFVLILGSTITLLGAAAACIGFRFVKFDKGDRSFWPEIVILGVLIFGIGMFILVAVGICKLILDSQKGRKSIQH